MRQLIRGMTKEVISFRTLTVRGIEELDPTENSNFDEKEENSEASGANPSHFDVRFH